MLRRVSTATTMSLKPHPIFSKVVSAMQEIAPLDLADRSWDNVGVLVESPHVPRNANGSADNNSDKAKVFLTIDLTPAVAAEALTCNADAIVAYHPFIFMGLKSLTLRDPKQVALMHLVQAGVSVYSPHSALDACVGGINDWLCDIVDGNGANKKTRVPITPASETKTDVGVGRVERMKEAVSLCDIIKAVKAGTGTPNLRVAVPDELRSGEFGNILIKSFAVCAGSGSSVFRGLRGEYSRPDLILSGELGHHDVLGWIQRGACVILCEHTNSERGYLSARLAPNLKSKLPEATEVMVSSVDADPLRMF